MNLTKLSTLITGTLIIAMLCVSPSMGSSITSIDYDLTDIKPTVNSIDSNHIWIDENAWMDITDEGEIRSHVSIRSNDLTFDQLKLDTLIPSEIKEILSWANMHTWKAYHPQDQNLRFEFNFRTNMPQIAENAAILILDSMRTQVAFVDLEFMGSYGYDENHGDGFEEFTRVEYSGHIDWINMIKLIDNSVPRNYGGLSSTINVTESHNLNFNFWPDGDGVSGEIGVYFQDYISEMIGGHELHLGKFFRVDKFEVADFAQSTNVDVRMPKIFNLTLNVFNTTNTNVRIQYFDGNEPQHNNMNTFVMINLRDDASYNDINVNFDFEFIPRDWKNIDQVYWNINARGYSEIDLWISGKTRAALVPNLTVESALLNDVIGIWLNVERNVREDSENYWLSIYFAQGTDYLYANTTATAIVSELETIGFDFEETHNESNWDEADRTIWNDANESEVFAEGINFGGYLDSDATLETIIENSHAAQQSNILQDASSINRLTWNLYNTKFGKASRVQFQIDPLHDTITNPIPVFEQGVEKQFTYDILRPNQLGWNGTIPWSNDLEELQINFRAPFKGDFQAIEFIPSMNNGFGWDTGRWVDNWDQKQRFGFDLRLYTSTPTIQAPGNSDPNQPQPPATLLNEVKIKANNYYYTDNDDLEAPHINEMWIDNSPSIYDDLDGYSNYMRIYEKPTFKGVENFAIMVEDSSQHYWNGTEWIPRYPSSGIANVTSYFYRQDAPIDHPLFTHGLSFTHNSTWENNSPNRQIWDGTLDTSILPDGEYELWAETLDNSNNFGDNWLGTFTIDNYDDNYTASSIIWSDSTPKDGDKVGNIAYFDFSITDDVGVYAVIAYNNLGGYIQEPLTSSTNSTGFIGTYSFKVDLLAQNMPENAPMTITIEVLDMDGHWTYSEVTVIVDNIPSGDPPTIELLSPANNIQLNNSETTKLLFSVNVTDDLGIESVTLNIFNDDTSKGYSMFANDESLSIYEYELDLLFLETGNYSWDVVVIDIDENQHIITSEERDFEIFGNAVIINDTTPPVIKLISHNDGDTVTGVIDLIAEVQDDYSVSQVVFINPSGVEAEMISSENNTYISEWNSEDVVDGSTELSIRAVDGAGNSVTLTFSLNANNGRTASTPAVGISLPGFGLIVSLLSIIGLTTIVRQKNNNW